VRRRGDEAAPDPQPDDATHARAGDRGPAAKVSVSAGADASSGARAEGQQDAAGPGSSLDGGEEPGSAPPLWYLKDWHFTTDFPGYQAGSHAM